MASGEHGVEVRAGDEAGGGVVFAHEPFEVHAVRPFTFQGFGGGRGVGMVEQACFHTRHGDGFGVRLDAGELVSDLALLLVRAGVVEVVLLLASAAGDVLQVAWGVRVGREQYRATVHGHALAAVYGAGVSGFASRFEEFPRDLPTAAVGQAYA